MNRCLYITMVLLALCSTSLMAQSTKAKKHAIKWATIASKIVNKQGEPIANVVISGNEGRTTVYSKADGSFRMVVPDKSPILFETIGYEDKVVEVKNKSIGNSITMDNLPLFSGSKDIITMPSGFSTSKREMVGAATSINGSNLTSYSDLVLDNALAGKLPGLTVIQQPGNLGKNRPELVIRGYNSLENRGAVILVDGIERSIDGLLAEEIESIAILKDATSKILYGPRAANGVILVSTKRGESYKRIIKVSADYGVSLPSVSMPKFLNSQQYATLYNEAAANDGLSPFYDQAAIDGYGASSGMNDLRYPNLDYYDYFLKKSGTYRKITTQFIGGNRNVSYALIAGYMGASGLEKVGKTPIMDRLNIRGNLDVQVTPALKVSMDIAGRIELNNSSYMSSSAVFNAMSSHRPNEYPIFIQGDQVDHEFYGDEILGGSLQQPYNLYADLEYGGYKSDRYFAGQTNLAFDLDMKKIVKGMKAKAYVTLDNYSFLSKGQNLDPVTYAPLWTAGLDGNKSLSLIDLTARKYQGDVDIMGTDNNYNIGYFGALYYDKKFAEHNLNLALAYNFFRKEMRGTNQDIKNSNLVFKGNYNYANKYLFEADVAMMGSSRFEKGNRQQVFPAMGLGWIISQEPWLRSVKAIDYLKLRASFGIIGYDATAPSYLYEQRWSNKGDIGFGNPNDDTSVSTVGSSYAASPGLKWEKSRETNIGLDVLLLKKRLNISVDVFDNLRYDIIQQVRSNYPATAGHILPYENWGKVSSHGFEIYANWSDRHRDFSYSVGASASYAISKIKRQDEIDYSGINSHRATVGKPVDAIFGYISNGLFAQGFKPSDYPIQTLGNYTSGDIRYQDLNKDGVIDNLDCTAIGNTLPRTTLSLELNLGYKGFGLYLLGTSHLGVDKVLSNTYYWNYGNNKYSEKALERWHPTNNPGGKYPRLTTQSGANNFTSSDFWIENGNFFRLKNVELNYTFVNKSLNPTVSQYKVYVRATNLFTISKIKDVDPEVTNAGISSYPVFTNIVGGIAVTF